MPFTARETKSPEFPVCRRFLQKLTDHQRTVGTNAKMSLTNREGGVKGRLGFFEL
jgi:hypothetical protein